MTTNLHLISSKLDDLKLHPQTDVSEIVLHLPGDTLNAITQKLGGERASSPEHYRSTVMTVLEDIVKEGAQEIEQTDFRDCGFDPRFNFDGIYLLPTEKKTKAQSIFNVLFTQKPQVQTPGNKQEELVLECLEAEEEFAQYVQKYFMTAMEANYIEQIPFVEYQFFRALGELHKTYSKDQTFPDRPYPVEVLLPIHHIKKPQSGKKEFNFEKAARWGFWRLSSKSKSDSIKHHEFIQAIELPAIDLKQSCRKVRAALIDIKSKVDEGEKISKAAKTANLRQLLGEFNAQWNYYVASHELLTDAQKLWSQHDIYKSEYIFGHKKLPALTSLQIESDEGFCLSDKEKKKMEELNKTRENLMNRNEEAIRNLARAEFPRLTQGVNI